MYYVDLEKAFDRNDLKSKISVYDVNVSQNDATSTRY